MSSLLKASGDAEAEQPLREGWLVKQSGGATGGKGQRVRRRSVGELMKKWDERYFVLTCQRLYYFKTMEDFKAGKEPAGVVSINDHAVEPVPDENAQFRLRGWDRMYKFKADDEGMCGRWITALRAVQISAMAEWTVTGMAQYGRLMNFPDEANEWMAKNSIDGNKFGRLKDVPDLATKGYTGRSDQIWSALNNLRQPSVHDWLTRFSAFCQRNATERQLENAEMLCLIRLGKGLEIMNSLKDEVKAPAAPAAAATPAGGSGGMEISMSMLSVDGDDEGPVADDV